ncbi:hypothetical protein [Rhodococcus olei]|uniref:hypothetical protein n=1 Tax=Rhodococcus olei TaxID=2161675 RepID=UPI0031E90F60
MNSNVAQLLAVLAAGIGGTAMLQGAFRQAPGGRGPRRRSFRAGEHLLYPHG